MNQQQQQQQQRIRIIANHIPNTPASYTSSNDPYCKQEGLIVSRLHGNGCLQIILNRPKALNALSYEMIQDMMVLLERALNDDKVAFVLVTSNSPKAFCAGGDIKMLTDDDDEDASYKFFGLEYNLNHLIHSYPKPYIALLNGITMGGGVGISIYGSHRVASENLLFAMPETSIGLFPDVGGSYFLSHLPPSLSLGLYIGLTGVRLRAADAQFCNFITHYVPSSKFAEVEKCLTSTTAGFVPKSGNAYEKINELLARFDESQTLLGASEMKKIFSKIDSTFGQGVRSVGEIMQRLEAQAQGGCEWSKKTVATLKTKSPTSMVVTFEAITRGSKMNLDEVLKMEYEVANRCVRLGDFKEGVRAVLVDKDNKPAWKSIDLSAQGNQEVVKAYFDKK